MYTYELPNRIKLTQELLEGLRSKHEVSQADWEHLLNELLVCVIYLDNLGYSSPSSAEIIKVLTDPSQNALFHIWRVHHKNCTPKETELSHIIEKHTLSFPFAEDKLTNSHGQNLTVSEYMQLGKNGLNEYNSRVSTLLNAGLGELDKHNKALIETMVTDMNSTVELA